MQDKFPNMENYTLLSQLTPDVYGYVNSVVLVGKNNGSEVYRMPRTSQYMPAYSPIRDRMFMGLHVVYAKIIEMLKDKPINNGGFKNYFLVTVETGNDKPQKVISFDGYIIEAEDPNELIQLNKFRAIPGIDNKKLHSAIFLLNRQYEEDMKLIDIENTVFHMKAFRHRAVRVDTFELEDCKFDMEDENCQKFIQSVFNGTNRSLYSIGLTYESTELLRNITGKIDLKELGRHEAVNANDDEKKNETPKDESNSIADATNKTEEIKTTEENSAIEHNQKEEDKVVKVDTKVVKEPKREMKDLGVLDIGEVLGNDNTVIHERAGGATAKTVEIED